MRRFESNPGGASVEAAARVGFKQVEGVRYLSRTTFPEGVCP
jgi:hypothetical protein